MRVNLSQKDLVALLCTTTPDKNNCLHLVACGFMENPQTNKNLTSDYQWKKEVLANLSSPELYGLYRRYR